MVRWRTPTFHADRLRRSCGGPVSCHATCLQRAYRISTACWTRAEAPDVTALTIGHGNQNKRVELVIRAIGSSDALPQPLSLPRCGSRHG